MSYLSVVRRRLALAAFLGLALVAAVALILPGLPVGGPLGAFMARHDLSQGTYAYKAPLSTVAWEKEWKRTMHCEYGIQIKNGSAHPYLAPFQDSYNQAYNRVQLEAIQQRFGSNVVFSIRDRLRQAWNTKTAKS